MRISNRELELLKRKHRGASGKNYLEDIKRLSLGEPIDYILGNSEFLGCVIDLSFKPLIPRVETEYWVELAIAENKAKKDIKVLDIFSGSGCIGVAVAKSFKKAQIYFADSESNCLKQIKKNIKINRIKNEVKVIKSDIFSKVNEKFDLIFANPPYIPASRKKSLPKSVVAYESGKYLFSGLSGLSTIKKFIKGIGSHLNPGGVGYMEFDSGQYAEIKRLIKAVGLRGEIRKDQYGKYRWVKIFN